MATVGREYCRECGRTTSQCGQLSYRGKCSDCSRRNIEDAPAQIIARSGPHYDAWLRGQREALESHAAA